MLKREPCPALFLVLALAVTVFGPASLAQPPSMALDIRTGPLNDPPWLTGPYTFARLDGLLYFSTDDGVHGFELWRTDGTVVGTEMVADVCPGQCSGVPHWTGTAAGDSLFFVADDGIHGRELWASDGTSEGTRMVRDIAPAGDSRPDWLTPFGDRLAFTAQDEEHGRELWITDGTEAGTVRLEDLNPGAGDSKPSALLVTAGTLFFNAFEPVTGREPWASDGTPGSAVSLGDLSPGSDDSALFEQWFPTNPRYAAVTEGLYFFASWDVPAGDTQLWVSDGSPGGTLRLTSFDDPTLRSSVADLTTHGADIYFVARDAATGFEIWRSDGTVAGTERVTDVQPGPDGSAPSGLTVLGNQLFFADSTDATGTELWVTDGTAAGTSLVSDINPGPDDSVRWSFAWTGGWPLDADRLLFLAYDGTHGLEPWVTDGTDSGTFLLGDVAPGDLSSNLFFVGPYVEPAPVDGGLIFFSWNPEVGFEPWWTDGSQAGTRLLVDLNQQASSQHAPYWFPVVDVASVGDRWFFQAIDDDHGLELWVSAGTPGTTRLVEDVETGTEDGEPLGSSPFGFAPLGDALIYQTRILQPSGSAIGQAWRSDGTAAGTFPLVSDDTSYAFSAAGTGFFQGDSGFWTTDGTAAGTRLVAGLDGGSEPAELAGEVFLAGRTDVTGQELYRLDPDFSQASLVADIVPGPDSSYPGSLTAVGGLLVFSAESPATGREIWVSDGSEGGTRILADVRAGPEGSMEWFRGTNNHGVTESPPIVTNGELAFIVADDGVHGEELWVSDGTPGGTRLLADVNPGPHGSSPFSLTDVGGRLYFRAVDGTSGAELWVSDGSPAGTHRVADLAPGEASSDPRFLVDVDGMLHFTAWTPATGAEMWRLNAAGEPELAADIVPGPGSSSPSYLAVAGRRLFFFATDGTHGYEPWSLVLPSRKLRVSLSSRRDGNKVFLNIVLTNPTPVDQPDATGDELVLPLPDALSLVTVEATGGRAEVVSAGALGTVGAAPGTDHTLLWNGALPAGATETITVELTLVGSLSPPIQLQADLYFDTDADGINDLSVPSDDPALPGEADPTVINAVSVVEVPALGTPGAALLIALLLVGALWRLRAW